MYEILAPAGNKQCALAAIESGANALYLGYSAFSARASADNFDLDGLREIIQHAHLFGVKVYVTMNTLVKDGELDEFISTLLSVHNSGADGILLQDIFLGRYIHDTYPDVVLHLSTQAGCNNVEGALLAKEYGFSRVVLARETAIADIKEISKIIETEVFVQGALCSSFSGQCYFSSFIGGLSGNRGRCKQPCRKKYTYSSEEKQNYALSLSDLCVGEKVKELLSAGVYSLKIEGRMRRAEYVAAAVRYYKGILEGAGNTQALSDLKRSYNRGNYTQGLAFGQDKRFLSTAVQGHIGEKVGNVQVKNGQFFVESKERFQEGDGFKILRSGEEVGGAKWIREDKRGFYLASRTRLKNGDTVFVTTDGALNERLIVDKGKKLPVFTQVKAQEGAPVSVSAPAYGLKMQSDFCLQTAKNSPLSKEELASCFEKTDGVIEASVEAEIVGNCFAAKSQLNGFRRAFYDKLYALLKNNGNTPYEKQPLPRFDFSGVCQKTAVMGEEFSFATASSDPEIYVVKPSDYAVLTPSERGESYLYLPPFLSGEDIKNIEQNPALSAFDGIYAEGTYGMILAKKWNKKLFAGTGFHLSNRFAVNEVKKQAAYYALSKELDFAEQEELSSENAFVLDLGGIKLMDLIYCPFGKKCSSCNRGKELTLTDEGGRNFPVRRYKISGNCRFEVYNCAYLLSPQRFAGSLIDLSTLSTAIQKAVAENQKDQEKIKKYLFPVTNGHSKKSVL